MIALTKGFSRDGAFTGWGISSSAAPLAGPLIASAA